MMKEETPVEKYERPELEIIEFEAEDVIVTSGEGETNSDNVFPEL